MYIMLKFPRAKIPFKQNFVLSVKKNMFNLSQFKSSFDHNKI